jgi:hypothetical protein
MAADGSRPARELRIGDAERTAAAQELGEHYAQGRLSAEEHQERLDRVMTARIASDLTPVFADLPGSAYQGRPTYATAGQPGVGSEQRRPFPAPPFGRPPFGRPPYAGRPGFRRGLPFPVVALLVLLAAAFAITHLPLLLIGLVVWFVLVRKHRHRIGYHRW